MIDIGNDTMGVQNVVNEHLQVVVSVIDSEIYQMIKSLGFDGEIHEVEKIQGWLDSSNYTMGLDSMRYGGADVYQYSIKENGRVLESVFLRISHEDSGLRAQISKEDYGM